MEDSRKQIVESRKEEAKTKAKNKSKKMASGGKE
jgi:hypothetical protein